MSWCLIRVERRYFNEKGRYCIRRIRKLMEFGNFANHYAAYVTTKFGSAQVMPDFETVKEFWEEMNL